MVVELLVVVEDEIVVEDDVVVGHGELWQTFPHQFAAPCPVHEVASAHSAGVVLEQAANAEVEKIENASKTKINKETEIPKDFFEKLIQCMQFYFYNLFIKLLAFHFTKFVKLLEEIYFYISQNFEVILFCMKFFIF